MTDTQSFILFKQRHWRLKANKETAQKVWIPTFIQSSYKTFQNKPYSKNLAATKNCLEDKVLQNVAILHSCQQYQVVEWYLEINWFLKVFLNVRNDNSLSCLLMPFHIFVREKIVIFWPNLVPTRVKE